jgi:CCR4-NOT transcription complex subunit 7/8
MVADGLTSVTPDGDILRVREVWADNLDEEMALIRGVVERHPFVAMDTEFPGVVARPVGNFRNSGEYHYQTLR